jgi:hypothetical protein
MRLSKFAPRIEKLILFFIKENFENNLEFSQFKWSQQMMPPFLSLNNKKQKISPPPQKKKSLT